VKFEGELLGSVLRNNATLSKKNWGSKPMSFKKVKFSKNHQAAAVGAPHSP
jgi:hypothetical protein